MSREEALQRQLARERIARQEAEGLLEGKSRELYDANRQLESRRATLEHAVEERTSALRESEARIRAILESAADGIITIDQQGIIDSFNAAATSIFGYTTEEVIGSSVTRLMPEPYRSQHDGFIRRYLDGGAPRVIGTGRETVGLRKDGTTFPMYLSVSEVVVGELRRFTGIAHDLSEQKETEAALAAARRREAEIGGRIQQALLFGDPPEGLLGIDIAALSIPSQSIDGDFIDFYRNDDMCVDLVIGDVMGKGVIAALVGAGTKSQFLRALNKLMTGTRLPRLEVVVGAVDSVLTPQLIELETFVTALYARVKRATGTVEFVDCGHTGILHYSAASDTCSTVVGENIPLGVVEGESFKMHRIDVESGDALLLFSDGITEAHSPTREPFGLLRLQECLHRHRHLEGSGIVREVLAAVVDFTGSEDFRDDFTCIAVKIEAPFGEAASHSGEFEMTSDPSELGRMRSFLSEATSDAGVDDPRWCNEFVTAVSEAVTNVIRHAYLGQSGQPILIRLEVYPAEVVVRISHSGVGLKRHSMPSPALDGTQDGGFGLYMIEQLMSRIAYYRDSAGNDCMLLVKGLPVP
jgi:sigma-B regulation protein RsbU (phosphoserine phosphatase)